MTRVYVSSTFKDLRQCREKVRHALRQLDHIDVAMEYDAAQDERPADKCLQDVEGCDLYICLVAWRYGFVPDGYEHSITELEYRRAVESGRPVLAFLLDEGALWPPLHVDRNRDQVEAFRETLKQNHTTAFFTSDTDIAACVNAAVMKWEKQQGIAGARRRVDWNAYRRAVIGRYRFLKLDAIAGPELGRVQPVAITDIFVAQQTATDRTAFGIPEAPGEDTDEDGDAPRPDDTVAELREPSLQIIGREPRQILLGGPGSGKTTLLQYAMLTLCNQETSETRTLTGLRSQPLPFLVDLRSYTSRKNKGQAGDFIDFLVTEARASYVEEIEPADLRALLQQKDATLVLFDGLDEVFKDGDRDQVASEIVAFARRYDSAKVVVTSRIVGYSSEPLQGAGFGHYRLQPFGLPEIRRFLPEWYRRYTWDGDQSDATELVEKIANNPRLRDLAGNPLLLTMIAIISKRHELPETRWKLYKECTDVLLERWDIRRKKIERDEVFPLDFVMDGDQKAMILRQVARRMLQQHEDDAGGQLNAIQREPLLEIIAAYLEQERGKDPGEAEILAGEILDHLRERTAILVEIGENLFGFVHRCFMEYFAACDLLAEFSRSKADYPWLTDLYGTYWERDEWQEVLLLLIAMLADQEFPIQEVVDHLVEAKVREPPWNLVFAARCLAEAGATDGPWEREIVDRLGHSILEWAGERDTLTLEQFVWQALRSFSMLVPAVRPSEDLVARIDVSEDRIRLSLAVAAWQMKLALRPKEERLALALPALDDRRVAIRIGAVSTLEREWPGREVVGARLVEVFRTDESSRVRLAAVQALWNAWPKHPGTLEAIAERVGDAADEPFLAIRLAQYVAAEWRNEIPALEVVLRLAAEVGPPSSVPHTVLVPVSAAHIITTGWGDLPGIGGWLRDRFDAEPDPLVRDLILVALAADGLAEEGMLGWLQEQVDAAPGLSPWTRGTALTGIARRWSTRPEVQAWLARHARGDPRPDVQVLALALAGGHRDPERLLLPERADSPVTRWPGAGPLTQWNWWLAASDWHGRTESAPLLEELAASGSTPMVRQVALAGVYAYRKASGAGLDLLRARLQEEDDAGIRGLLLLWLGEAASGDLTLPHDLAGTLGFYPESPRTTPARPFEGFSRPATHEDGQLRTTLAQVAGHDDDPYVRAAATHATAALWPDVPAVAELLEERIRNEPAEQVRPLLRSFRTRLQMTRRQRRPPAR